MHRAPVLSQRGPIEELLLAETLSVFRPLLAERGVGASLHVGERFLGQSRHHFLRLVRLLDEGRRLVRLRV